MTTFLYEARAATGGTVRGALETPDRASALTALAARDLFITSLYAQAELRGVLGAILCGRPRKNATVTLFRSLAALVAAGVPVRRSIDVAREQSACRILREALASIAHDIDAGMPLSAAFSRRAGQFAPSTVVMLAAGEAGGLLDETLQRIAQLYERRAAYERRIATSLAYPAFVSCAALALLAFLIAGVVPMFAQLYQQLRVPLPHATALLLAAGEAFHGFRAAAALSVLGASITSAAAMLRVRRVRDGASAAVYRLPIVGRLARKSACATIARMLSSLLRSGVALTHALDVTADAAGVVYAKSLRSLKDAVASGSSLTGALATSTLFEPFFVQFVRVGEETGALDAMLEKASEYYEADVETALQAATGLIEPAMVLVLGGAVAAIVSAILLPLYAMIGSIR